jgi:hypothetical protein
LPTLACVRAILSIMRDYRELLEVPQPQAQAQPQPQAQPDLQQHRPTNMTIG